MVIYISIILCLLFFQQITIDYLLFICTVQSIYFFPIVGILTKWNKSNAIAWMLKCIKTLYKALNCELYLHIFHSTLSINLLQNVWAMKYCDSIVTKWFLPLGKRRYRRAMYSCWRTGMQTIWWSTHRRIASVSDDSLKLHKYIVQSNLWEKTALL